VSRNLGETTLCRRARSDDPMRAYDALPPELRRWMAGAALPWSPRSCARLWAKAGRKGLTPDAATALLDTAERRTLTRDRSVHPPGLRASDPFRRSATEPST
jgi:hypothetical protein